MRDAAPTREQALYLLSHGWKRKSPHSAWWIAPQIGTARVECVTRAAVLEQQRRDGAGK